MRKMILACVALVLATACGQEGPPVDALATGSPTPAPTEAPTPEPSATPGETEEPEPTAEPEATPGDWERIEHGGLSFEIRSDMEDQEPQGIDSQVGHFKGVGIELEYDYGWYSGDPADEMAPSYEDHWIRIDDRLAHVSYSRRMPGARKKDDLSTQYEYFGSVYFPDTEDTSDSTPKPAGEATTSKTKLSLLVYSNAGWVDAERIIGSIRFDD
ncbi:MAG: hypothetical protein WD826_00160 [Actinomycetota bacterium]